MRPLLRAAGRAAGRAVSALGTLVAASAVLFGGSQVLPGDAASASLGVNATPGDLLRVRAELGLDRPVTVQYLDWIRAAVRGDLGHSLIDGQPVSEVIARPFLDTALLVLLTTGATIVLAIGLGLLTGLRPGSRLDRMISGATVAIISIPQFVTAGLLVLLFATTLGMLPSASLVPFGGSPLDRPVILVLPVLSLTLFAGGWASRIVRAAVVDANAAPYVAAARLAGLSRTRVLVRHMLPATIPPCAQTFGWLIGALFGGTAVVERVFGYPGLSQTLVDAVRHHDVPVLEGVGLVLAAVLVVGLVLADLMTVLASPRLRTAR